MSRTRLMSSRAPSMPIEPGTRPMPPAMATADTSSGFATKPIGEFAIGTSAPRSRVMRLSKRAAELILGRLSGCAVLRWPVEHCRAAYGPHIAYGAGPEGRP